VFRRLDCERVMVRTAAGGGQAGPLRIDLAGRFAGSCMRAYSEAEARQAFQRMEAQHRASGWDPAGGGGSGAAPYLPLLVETRMVGWTPQAEVAQVLLPICLCL